MRLLIISDDPASAKFQAMSLSGSGFTVETVPGLTEATQLLESTNFDAILVNGGKENENIEQGLQQLRAAHPTLSVLKLTPNEISTVQEASTNASSASDKKRLLSKLNSIL